MSSSPFWMPIEPRNLRELMKTGYCVIDNFIHDESVAKKMREEMCSMPIRYENEEEEEKEKKMPCMRPNRTHFTDAKNNAKRYLFSKPGVFEYDMHMNTVENSSNNINGSSGSMATLDRFFEATGKLLAEAFNEAAKEEALSAIDDEEEDKEGKQQKHRSYARVIKVKPGDENRTVKLQINTCGAFPYHFDNPGGARQNRKLTCILYLNEAYEDKCGGEIVLVPFMGPFVTIRPIFNRLVVFQSETVLHRVNKAVNFPGERESVFNRLARRRRRFRRRQRRRKERQETKISATTSSNSSPPLPKTSSRTSAKLRTRNASSPDGRTETNTK